MRRAGEKPQAPHRIALAEKPITIVLAEFLDARHVEDTNGANRTMIEAIAKGHRWQVQPEPACQQAGPSRTPARKTWPRTSAATAPTSAVCSA